MARSKNPFADPAAAPQLPYGDVEPGSTLGGRYRLDEPLTSYDDITLWEGHDQTLDRTVLMYVIPPNHRRTEALLVAARAAATATDARFLRVLDALEYGPIEPVSCVVTEYVPGCRLSDILARGPLSGLGAAWLVAQLAGALTPMHGADLFHQRLNPTNVLITATGDVRIAGFLLEAALTPRLGDDGFEEHPSRGEAQRADLDALGQLFYASLTGTWPLLSTYEPADLYGLPPAPRGEDGLLVSPATLRPGLSLTLDAICLQTLEPRPDGAAVRRAADLASVLGRLLGPADASEELATRAHAAQTGQPVVVPQPEAGLPAEVAPAEDAATEPGPSVPAEPATPVVREDSTSSLLPPAPHLDAVTRPLAPRWVWWVAVAVVIVLAIVLVVKACSGPSAPSGPTTVTIAAGRDFDPTADGGNGEEFPDLVPLTYDGNPDTAWTSETYLNNPKMGGLKPGVGLIYDLGTAHAVTQVTLTMGAVPVTVELRIPATDPAGAAPPADSQTQWTPIVAPAAYTTSPIVMTPATPATTRWVLVYFSSLAPVSDKRFQAIVDEVTVQAQR